MSAQTATRLNPNELTAHEVQTLESLAAEYSASPALHILVNMILAAKESGEPLEIFSHDKELSPNQAAQLIFPLLLFLELQSFRQLYSA